MGDVVLEWVLYKFSKDLEKEKLEKMNGMK
jgi:hypothetical protein